ncbi:MAG: DNA polymerase I [Spirochaetes bacterium]|nr:DNA polymerase I [Spirochaetota bacterium]
MKKFYIVDGHALCYRAYFAFMTNPLINSKGQNTSAIFGFARMLLKLIKDNSPDYIAVAFDPPVKTFRFKMYSEYKANRAKMPDDLKSQIEEIKNLVSVLNIPVIIDERVEADDILGSAAEKFSKSGYEVILVTGDKDAYQLVNDRVKIYANKKGISDYVIYDEAEVLNKIGLKPSQIIDYMALVGDSADNIPGVKGIGPKTAVKFISEFGSLDGIYEHIDEIKGANQTKLIENKEMAYLSRDLVTIKTDVEIDFKIEDAEFKDFDNRKAYEYFKNLEMKSIAEEFFKDSTAADDNETGVIKTDIVKNYRCVQTVNELNSSFKTISKCDLISIDSETTSVQPMEADLVGVSISIEEGQGWYFPVMSNSLFNDHTVEYTFDDLIDKLRPVLENADIRKVGQNIKYDYIIFRNAGIRMKNIYFDTMIASYLIDPSVRRHNMDDMAEFFLNYKTTTYNQLVGKGKYQLPISEIPLDEVTAYACEDSDITLRLYHVLKRKLEENDLMKLFSEIEMPLLSVLADMEITGVKIDPAYFAELSALNDRNLIAVEKKIIELAGENFNINSTKELSYILFTKLGLKPVKKTKTGLSTDITVLESLVKDHEIINYLIQYRTLSKLKSTYIDSLPKMINSRTGRIHTSYNQTVAATGRLSSTDPNLQNIPMKDDFGRKIRGGFIADSGYTLLSSDYSQIELRLAAHLSRDVNMKKAFNDGIDIHAMTASSTFGVDVDKVEPWMRRQAKIINFATIYGVSPYGLSQQADISMSDAKKFIDKYFETYPGFRKYIDETVAFAREKKYVITLAGRKRPVPEINNSVSFRREGAERIAINTPIQGTSADMIKIAMINIHRIFAEKKLKSRMIMQVHDELVVEVLNEEKDAVLEIVENCMRTAMKLDVVIKVDSGWGPNWNDAH